jgi:hypothetical protein
MYNQNKYFQWFDLRDIHTKTELFVLITLCLVTIVKVVLETLF